MTDLVQRAYEVIGQVHAMRNAFSDLESLIDFLRIRYADLGEDDLTLLALNVTAIIHKSNGPN